MKKKQVYILAASVVVLALAAWGGYKYFYSKTTVTTQTKNNADQFVKNAAWLYHEYVYRVDFSDTALRPFFFVQNSDGTFSPSQADSSGNHISGNGFLADSTGALMMTDMMARPWVLSPEGERPLREMTDAWLAAQEFVTDKSYRVTGQTVVLFAVLNEAKDYIEYNVAPAAPGQEGYALAYPAEMINLSGLSQGMPVFSTLPPAGTAMLRIVKTVMNKNAAGESAATTLVDSVAADIDNAGYLGKLNAFRGDGFFYEGSVVFDTTGNFLGQLHYDNSKWKLMPVTGFVANPPSYTDTEIKETWGFDHSLNAWTRRSKIIPAGRPVDLLPTDAP